MIERLQLPKSTTAAFFEDKGTISFARELGMKKANGEYIAFTDADCVVGRDWLKKLRATIDTDTDVAGVGGPNITPEDDSPLAKSVGDFFELFSKVGARYGYSNDTTTEVEHNPTCNVFYRKKVIQEVGGFNEQLVTVDDEEMDYRIRQQGYKLLFRPDAVVEHYRRPTWRQFSSMAHSYGYGRGQAFRLHRELGRWFHFAPTITTVAILSLFVCTQFTALPLAVPALLLLSGEILVLGAAMRMRWQSISNIGTNVGIINTSG